MTDRGVASTAELPPGGTEVRRVLLLGSTGTIGQAVLQTLVAQGHYVVCAVRVPSDATDEMSLHQVEEHVGALENDTFCARLVAGVDTIISCIASRTGLPAEAWAVDYGVNSRVLCAAQAANVAQFILLSAICVQRPLLAFQKAKLAFEAELKVSGMRYSIVRPTAFFKSLSGQMRRVQQGKPFLVFGDGEHTACKPISDRDLAAFITHCMTEPACSDAVLPVGGPGPALTPLMQAELLGQALGYSVPVRHVPVALMHTIVGVLTPLGLISQAAYKKAELARIGRYYATQSMLVFDAHSGAYSAEATPEFGADTLAEHYERLARGDVTADLGVHSVF